MCSPTMPIFRNVGLFPHLSPATLRRFLQLQLTRRPTAPFYSRIRTFGQSIGLAVSVIVFQNQSHQKLLNYLTLAGMADKYICRFSRVCVDRDVCSECLRALASATTNPAPSLPTPGGLQLESGARDRCRALMMDIELRM